MKDRKEKSRVPILAAGGIVLRNDRRPQFAIVQLRKLGAWGLPKGKLAPGEDALAAARREVLEETGHRVTIHEFLGTLAYEASARPKVVQFWRMHAISEPIADLMRDVRAVHWLELEDAIDRLTHLRERVFLEHVGPTALRLAERSARRDALRGQRADKSLVRRALSAARLHTIGTGVPLAPAAGDPVEDAQHVREQELTEQDFALVPAADALTLDKPSWRVWQNHGTESGVGRTLIEKTWGWLRHAAMSHRQPPD